MNVFLLTAMWICETVSPVKPSFVYEKEFYQIDPAPAPGTSCFLKAVPNGKAVRTARWTVSGLGVFEAYVNGQPVGSPDADRPRLKPGFTDARKTRHSFSFDVTDLMKRDAGATNVFAAEVSSGWWRDRIARFHGKRSAFYGELTLEYADGTTATVGTDTSWLAGTRSPVRRAGIFYGEDFDARISRDWMTTGVAPDFAPATPSDEFTGELLPLEGPSIRWREDLTLKPVRVYSYSGATGAAEDRFGRIASVRERDVRCPGLVKKGETLVVDFGQNASAVPRLAFAGARGVTVTLAPREMLNDAEGRKSRGNDGPEGSLYLSNVRGARATATYVFAGTGVETYAPEFTYFGYRYLALTATDDITVSSVVSVPVTSLSAAAETGFMETGCESVNRLLANVRWGMRSNYLSVPTDCPQRNERLGWTADTQVFAPTATRLADVDGFLSKWMRDMRDAQEPSGSYAAIAPFSQYDADPDRYGWADAGIIVPHVLWQRYGNTDVLRDHWESMKRMMARVSETRHQLRDGYFQFADWLSFEKYEASRMSRAARSRPDADTRAYWNFQGACYWLYDARLMSEMAKALGRAAEATAYAQEAERALAFIRTSFLDGKGNLLPCFADLQTANVFALRHGIFPDAAAHARGKAALLANIRAHGGCLQTGFLGTSFLMEVLDGCGATETAYDLLLNRKFPSWLYSVDQGATTIWERWNGYTKEKGFGPVSMNSFNHYAYGAVAEWMFATMAGIRPDPSAPGYRHVILAPRPDRRLGHVTAEQKTPCGTIRSAWAYGADGVWIWHYEIPAGLTATVVLPSGERRERGPGRYVEKDGPMSFPEVGEAWAITRGPHEHLLANYFGINAWSDDNRYVLVLETDINGRLPQTGERCTIGVVDLQDGNRFIPVTTTACWNFQEAAMGHWLDNDTILFNDLRDGRFVSVVMNWRTGKELRILPHPVSAVSEDRTWAVSINYARLYLTRPDYGYAGGGQDSREDVEWPEDDGLWVMDLRSGEAKLVLSVAQGRALMATPPAESGKPGHPLSYYCHTVISKDGAKIFFLARAVSWYDKAKNVSSKHKTTSFTVNRDGTELRRCFPDGWGGSHFNWAPDGSHRLLVTTPLPGKVWPSLVEFEVGKESEVRQIGAGILDQDWHCVYSPNGKFMSGEAYPNGSGDRCWLLLRLSDELVKPIGAFHVPTDYRSAYWRCDLHARWRRDGGQLAFNSVHEGSRQVYVRDVKWSPANLTEALAKPR